jgi:hypothetical protein
MARYSATWKGVAATAFADAANITDSAYPMLIQGGNGTQRINISEVHAGGEAAANAPVELVLARDSTAAATITAGTTRTAALDASATAPGTLPTVGHIATTKPQRSSTLHLLTLTFNAFGGLIRWFARPGEEPSIVGNTASLGEASLSLFTGSTSATLGGQMIYEVA